MAERVEKISGNAKDQLRQELEQKIKDSLHISFWIIGTLVVVLLASFGYLAAQISKIEDVQNRVTKLETKFEAHKEAIELAR